MESLGIDWVSHLLKSGKASLNAKLHMLPFTIVGSLQIFKSGSSEDSGDWEHPREGVAQKFL